MFIVFSPGCVDIWDPKVLKSAGIAPFVIDLLTDLDWSSIEAILPEINCRLLLADCGLKQPCHSNLPLRDYDRLSYQYSDSIVLVVGGETHGVSQSAYKLCASRLGTRIRIPMLPGVDSLNAAVSASVILYEIHRQISTVKSK